MAAGEQDATAKTSKRRVRLCQCVDAAAPSGAYGNQGLRDARLNSQRSCDRRLLQQNLPDAEVKCIQALAEQIAPGNWHCVPPEATRIIQAGLLSEGRPPISSSLPGAAVEPAP